MFNLTPVLIHKLYCKLISFCEQKNPKIIPTLFSVNCYLGINATAGCLAERGSGQTRARARLWYHRSRAVRIKISIWATHLCLNRYRASSGGTGVELEIIEFRYLENVTIPRLRSCIGGIWRRCGRCLVVEIVKYWFDGVGAGVDLRDVLEKTLTEDTVWAVVFKQYCFIYNRG